MKKLNYLNLVIFSQLLLENNDQLIGTQAYRQNLKNQINKLNVMLEDVVKDEFNKVYDVDPETTTNILNKIESLLDRIKTNSIEDLILIDSVIEKYNKDPKLFQEKMDVEFVKLN